MQWHPASAARCVVALIALIVLLARRIIKGVRKRDFSGNAVLIHVTKMFVFQTIEVPLPPP
jgi:bacteriorhodopsin